jgi:glucose/arabinose dehydrogenase
LVLVGAGHQELTNTEATALLPFAVVPSSGNAFTLEPVLTNLNSPTAMALAPDGRVFYNELTTGNIRIIDTVSGWQVRDAPFYHFSDVQNPTLPNGDQNTGLLAITLDPAFATNGYVYVYYTTADPRINRVVRLTDVNGQGISPVTIIDGIPAGIFHNGADLEFGPDGKLYITTGDADQNIEEAVFTHAAQDISFLGGKTLRLNPDGSIPPDNPFPNSPVYSLGHRNPFRAAFHPHTGHLWVSENGPTESDEVNRIVAGGNYGWDIVHGKANDPRFIDPAAVFYDPPCNPCTIAPTGIIAVPRNSAYPSEYHENLLLLDFIFGRVQRLILSGADFSEVGSSTVIFGGGMGPLFDIIQGPDGFMYISTPTSILRLVPNTST